METHLYAPGWETIADCDAALAPVRVYVLGGEGMDSQAAMLRKDSAGEWETLFYLRDHLGSVLALVDGAGAIVESYEYAPYGAAEITALDGVSPRKVAASVFDNRMLYTGREWDAAAGFYHYRHRTYSPREHRFMQGDPIGLGGGWNYYAYVGGNPANARDPLGLVSWWGPFFWPDSPTVDYGPRMYLSSGGVRVRENTKWGHEVIFIKKSDLVYQKYELNNPKNGLCSPSKGGPSTGAYSKQEYLMELSKSKWIRDLDMTPSDLAKLEDWFQERKRLDDYPYIFPCRQCRTYLSDGVGSVSSSGSSHGHSGYPDQTPDGKPIWVTW